MANTIVSVGYISTNDMTDVTDILKDDFKYVYTCIMYVCHKCKNGSLNIKFLRHVNGSILLWPIYIAYWLTMNKEHFKPFIKIVDNVNNYAFINLEFKTNKHATISHVLHDHVQLKKTGNVYNITYPKENDIKHSIHSLLNNTNTNVTVCKATIIDVLQLLYSNKKKKDETCYTKEDISNIDWLKTNTIAANKENGNNSLQVLDAPATIRLEPKATSSQNNKQAVASTPAIESKLSWLKSLFKSAIRRGGAPSNNTLQINNQRKEGRKSYIVYKKQKLSVAEARKRKG